MRNYAMAHTDPDDDITCYRPANQAFQCLTLRVGQITMFLTFEQANRIARAIDQVLLDIEMSTMFAEDEIMPTYSPSDPF